MSQDVTEADGCPICDATPEPCEEHPGSPLGPRGCQECNREAFVYLLAQVGSQRICDGSGMRAVDIACPGCAACATSDTPCPAFAPPDEPWTPASEKSGPCACCGGPIEKHRPFPPMPESPPIRGFRVLAPDDAPIGSIVLRDPR
jgi:hypothetical protein